MPIHGQKLPSHPPSTVMTARGRQLNTMLERLNRVSCPSGVQYGPMGPMIAPSPVMPGFVGIATSDFAARSGSNAGVGTINAVQSQATYSGGALTAMTLTQLTIVEFPAYYPSTLTQTSGNGIDSGQYVWAEYDQYGNLAVMPLDCQ